MIFVCGALMCVYSMLISRKCLLIVCCCLCCIVTMATCDCRLDITGCDFFIFVNIVYLVHIDKYIYAPYYIGLWLNVFKKKLASSV